MQEQDSLISVYDVSGKIISNKLRKDVDKKNDILKTVIILVINNQNKVFITKIPSNHFTERWGASAAGMVRKDEKIIDAAKRTLNRELDLLKNPIFLSENFYDFNVIKRFMSVFYIKTGDLPKVNPDDVFGSRWMTFNEIDKNIDSFIPTFRVAFEILKKKTKFR